MFPSKLKRLFYFCSLLAVAGLLSSCATVTRPPAVRTSQPGSQVCSIMGSNIVHIVAPGETLWRISKVYGVPMQEIIRANNLREVASLERGQQLIIPSIATRKTVVPLFRTNKWRYIIIHHSATDVGDASYLNMLHRRRGWNEIGYDFVIDNGTKGKADGAIEVTPRWINQENGAHCRAADMNQKGIGICLVGNFSEERVSEKEMNSLVYLVNVLKKYYGVPRDHILGHGQVLGARTECPGKLFPWREFRKRLDSCN
jgi:N-acetylmuramoyl-L-alanine amidase